MSRHSRPAAHDGAEMPFWDHLEQLRGALLRALALVALCAAGIFMAMPFLMDNVILAPCSPQFVTYRWIDRIAALSPFGGDEGALLAPISLINIRLASQFMLHLSLSFWLGVVAAFPGVIYQLWRFVEPGLLPRERAGARAAFLSGTAMFYAGVTVGYLIVFPLTLRFLAGYSLSPDIMNQLSLDSYMDNLMMLCLMMGLLFELPLVAWLLGRAGLLTRSLLKRYRRHAVVAILILAAIITPTGDPLTLAVVFLPVYLLWELSALFLPARQLSSTEGAVTS